MRRSWNRAGLVLALLVLAAAGVSGLLDRGLDRAIAPLAPEQSQAALHRLQLRAAEAYVTARALGRVVAVASSATVNAGVAVGGSIDIGRVLDPIDKLLETFADVMMASLIAITAQLILIDMFDATALPWVLPAGLAVLALAVATRRGARSRVRHVASMVILAALLARYALPVAVVTTEALSTRFLQHRAEAAAGVVDATRAEMAAAEAAEPSRAWYDPRRLSDQLAAMSPNDFAARIDRSVDAILTWMTVFILETIVMPLSIVVAVAMFARAALRRGLLVVP